MSDDRAQRTQDATDTILYRVQARRPAETVNEICARFGVTPRELVEANQHNPDFLRWLHSVGYTYEKTLASLPPSPGNERTPEQRRG